MEHRSAKRNRLAPSAMKPWALPKPWMASSGGKLRPGCWKSDTCHRFYLSCSLLKLPVAGHVLTAAGRGQTCEERKDPMQVHSTMCYSGTTKLKEYWEQFCTLEEAVSFTQFWRLWRIEFGHLLHAFDIACFCSDQALLLETDGGPPMIEPV